MFSFFQQFFNALHSGSRWTHSYMNFLVYRKAVKKSKPTYERRVTFFSPTYQIELFSVSDLNANLLEPQSWLFPFFENLFFFENTNIATPTCLQSGHQVRAVSLRISFTQLTISKVSCRIGLVFPSNTFTGRTSVYFPPLLLCTPNKPNKLNCFRF